MRRFLLTVAVSLLAGCVSTPTTMPPATQLAPRIASPQYLLVYALDSQHFLFAGHRYDDALIAPAVTAAGAADAVHVIVMRDAGQGVTVAELLAVIPALSNGQSCLFLQDAGGSMKTASMNGKDGEPVDQSFCPKFEDVTASVGSYAPPPQ